MQDQSELSVQRFARGVLAPVGKSTAASTAIDFKQICKVHLEKEFCSFLVQRYFFRRKIANEKTWGACLL